MSPLDDRLVALVAAIKAEFTEIDAQLTTGHTNPTDLLTLADGQAVFDPLGAAPISVKSLLFGAKGDSNATASIGTDDTAAIQAAIAYINGLGGGTLYFPAGYYKISSYLTLCKNLRIIGEGRTSSTLVATHAGGGGANLAENTRNGSILYSNWPSNGSTAANIIVQNLGLRLTNGANVGAQFYDNGGTFIKLDNVGCYGGKYGVIFDQTELADIDLCEFGSHTTGGIWLVNAGDLKSGNAGGFTNRIGVNRCQLNESSTAYGIIDDGGTAHSYTDNNYNLCLTAIRAAGVQGLKISGGEFEGSAASIVVLTFTALSGPGVGACSNVWVGGGADLLPAAGQSCINIASVDDLTISGVYFGASSAAKVVGCGNAAQIYAVGFNSGGGGLTFDGRATNHFEAGTNGTTIAIRTNLPILESGNQVITARQTGTAANATDLATAITLVNDLKAKLTTHGLIS